MTDGSATEKSGQPAPVLDELIAREALADAYRDAALVRADMTQAVALLEELRLSLASAADLFQAWEATSGAIGRSGPGPLRPVLAALRGRLHERLLATRLDGLRVMPPGHAETARAWLELLADALIRLQIEVVRALAEVPGPDEVTQVADMVLAYRRDLEREDYGLAYPLFEAVAAHPLTAAPARAALAARCAEIQVLRLNDLAAGRAVLDRIPASDGADSALVQNAWGVYWLARGDLAAARRCLQRAVDLDKSLSHPYRNFGDSYIKEEDPHAALTWYEAGRDNCPGTDEPYQSLLTFSTRITQIGRFRDTAPELIEMAAVLKSFAIDSVYLEATSAYAAVASSPHGEDGDWASAERYLERAAAIAPDRPDVLTWRSALLAKRGKVDEGLAVLRAADEAEPGRFDIPWQAANLCMDDGRDAEAAWWLGRALAASRLLMPEPLLRIWLEETFRRTGDLAAAEAELIRVLRQAPAAEGFVGVANDGLQALLASYLDADGREAADAALDRIVAALGPDQAAWRHAGTGHLEYAGQRYRDAAIAFQAAIELAPDVTAFRYSLVTALRDLGEFDAARQGIGDALAVDRDMVRSRAEEGLVANAEGNHRFTAGDYAGAIPLYQEAARLRPDDVVMFTNLANAWDLVADPERRKEAADGSYEALRQASELAPADIAITVRLAGLTAVRQAARDFGRLAFEPPPLSYEVGLIVASDLVPVVSEEGNRLAAEVTTAIAALRTRIWEELGVTLPGVNIADDPALPEGMTAIQLDGVEVVRLAAPAGQRFCAAAVDRLDAAGITAESRQPAALLDGTAGAWLAEGAWGTAESAGLTLFSRLGPVLAALTAVILANVHHLIHVDAVARGLGADAVKANTGKLPEFTQALRAHVADHLPARDVAALWARYLRAREAGATRTAATEALRAEPGALAVIADWCRTHRVALIVPGFEAVLASHGAEVTGEPVAVILEGEAARLRELLDPLAWAARSGFVLAANDAVLRPLVARALREVGIVPPVVAAHEVPDGISVTEIETGTDG